MVKIRFPAAQPGDMPAIAQQPADGGGTDSGACSGDHSHLRHCHGPPTQPRVNSTYSIARPKRVNAMCSRPLAAMMVGYENSRLRPSRELLERQYPSPISMLRRVGQVSPASSESARVIGARGAPQNALRPVSSIGVASDWEVS